MSAEQDQDARKLLEEWTKAIGMTPEVRRQQKISFAYGNSRLSHFTVNRKMIEEAAEKLDRND